MLIDNWRKKVGWLKNEITALYLAYRDPRTPWYARLALAAVFFYALSPIDLIPDFIPVLGYLDDLIILPLLINLALRLIPEDILADSRRLAREGSTLPVKRNWIGAIIIIAIWLWLVYVFVHLILRAIH